MSTIISNNNTIAKITDLDTILENNETNDGETDTYIIDLVCNYSYTIFFINLLFIIVTSIVLVTITIIYNSDLDKYFWVNQGSKYVVISIIQYMMAYLVIYIDIKVNYTRKVIHVSYFLIPQLLDLILIKYDKNKFTELWNVWIILFLLIILSEPVRKNICLIDTMFKAVDRPEDRPYTLIWFSSQIITTLIVILPFSVYFNRINRTGYVFIPILINGLADGMAEPVGIRFGTHKYQTKACLSNRKYERSYEGSLCVFIISLIIILSYYSYMTLYQYIFCSISIPFLITLTEAYSPHTWDSPCIFFVVCGLLSVSSFIE